MFPKTYFSGGYFSSAYFPPMGMSPVGPPPDYDLTMRVGTAHLVRAFADRLQRTLRLHTGNAEHLRLRD